MALLPARNIFDGSSIPTTGTMKSAMGSLRDFLSDLLGADSGNPTAARAALVAAKSGANDDITSLGTIANINGGQLAGMRSRIINGNFAINQRMMSGTVTLAAGAYGHDRWKAGSSGCTYTFSTTSGVTTLNITAGSLMQVIEGVNLDSNSFILSWGGTSTGRIDSGTFGVSGRVGTAVGGTNQTVEFSTGTLSRVQYEVGTVSTTFEQRPYGLELSLCQRYFERMGFGSTAALSLQGYSTSPIISLASWIPFKVEKRVIPTIGIFGVFVATNCGQPQIGGITVDGFSRYVITSGAAGQTTSETNNTSSGITATSEL